MRKLQKMMMTRRTLVGAPVMAIDVVKRIEVVSEMKLEIVLVRRHYFFHTMVRMSMMMQIAMRMMSI